MTALPMTQKPPTPPAAVSSEALSGEGLAELVSQRQAGVWRYLRFLGAQPAEADDLTQETFLAVARSGFSQRSEQETTGYLRTVARRQLLMLRRQQKRDLATAPLEAADAVWSEARADDAWQSLIDAAKQCVEKLAGHSRQAIDLAYQDKLGREAIAQRLGMKPDGVKTLLRRARAAVRECIDRAKQADK